MGLFKFVRFWVAVIKDLILLALYTWYVYIGIFFRGFFPRKPKSLKDEIILITGTANGIGREICLRLADSGAKLICWDISKRENIALVEELRAMGADASHYEVDVSDMSQVQKAAMQVKERTGEVTMLILNAGIMPCHEFLSHNPREITRSFNVNVYGPMWMLREFLPYMIEHKKGHIVAMCSAAGLVGTRNLVAYSGTKHAINGIIESLKEEIRAHRKKPDIKFTTVYPSPCNTSFAKNIVHVRFPWILPGLTEPSYVAEKTIEGIVNDQEYVYIPKVVNYIVHFVKALPPKVNRAVSDLMGIYVEPRNDTKTVGQRFNNTTRR